MILNNWLTHSSLPNSDSDVDAIGPCRIHPEQYPMYVTLRIDATPYVPTFE